jgi:hypothetical protein
VIGTFKEHISFCLKILCSYAKFSKAITFQRGKKFAGFRQKHPVL